MLILKWLLERHPEYQLLRERFTQMSDRALMAERRVSALEEKLEQAREKLIAEKDKWTEYVAAITNRPPVSGVREWMEQNRVMAREQYSRVVESQETVLQTVRQNQLMREKAKAEFEQQLPEFVEEKYKAANDLREQYFKSVPNTLDKFFRTELETMDTKYTTGELGSTTSDVAISEETNAIS